MQPEVQLAPKHPQLSALVRCSADAGDAAAVLYGLHILWGLALY